jgi:hypothetical protein
MMVDQQRHGELVYSSEGLFMDMENGERGYQRFTKRILEGERNGDGDEEWNGDDLKEFRVLKDLEGALKKKAENERQMKESEERDEREGKVSVESIERVQNT